MGENSETKYKKELDQSVPLVEEEVVSLQVQLNDEKLADDKTTQKDAIAILEKLEGSIVAIKEKGKTINELQKYLDMSPTFFESIESLTMDFSLKKKLWVGA